MIFDRIFGWHQLNARLEDKDKEIQRLTEEVKDLKDRLFIKHSLPVSGTSLNTTKGAPVKGYGGVKARLKEFINNQTPLVAPSLSPEELRSLHEASQ